MTLAYWSTRSSEEVAQNMGGQGVVLAQTRGGSQGPGHSACGVMGPSCAEIVSGAGAKWGSSCGNLEPTVVWGKDSGQVGLGLVQGTGKGNLTGNSILWKV